MKKIISVIFVLCFSSAMFAQRGPMATMDADRLYIYCKTFQTAFPKVGDGDESYKDRKQLVESTRAFNYVEAVMDESAGAHWDVSSGMEKPDVREWHWEVTTKEMIYIFVKWIDAHPENRLDPANVAIKEAGVAEGVYVYNK